MTIIDLLSSRLQPKLPSVNPRLDRSMALQQIAPGAMLPGQKTPRLQSERCVPENREATSDKAGIHAGKVLPAQAAGMDLFA